MGIQSYIQGQYITHHYSIRENRDVDTGKFKSKPELIKEDEIMYATLDNKNHDRLFVVDGEIGCNWDLHLFSSFPLPYMSKINLSEDEVVNVVGKIYRADLHAYMIHTDKIMSERDDSSAEDTKQAYELLVREYNEQMINDETIISQHFIKF